ncbi:MAG: hypothetical protein FJ398_14050 [Verrucomicrobia bacterium]|nr:hypothetical protein [Verrucomicrobiota bacterium]
MPGNSFHEPDGRASLSPASRVGRVPSAWSGSPGRTRPTGFMDRVQVRKVFQSNLRFAQRMFFFGQNREGILRNKAQSLRGKKP